MIGQKLDPRVYFSPSYSPMLDLNDSHKGSCFQDWYIPTASCIYDDDRESFLPKYGDFSTYKENLYKNIKQRIQEIYDQHRTVTLAYSGGIDSMVLLSFILKLDLINRTELICHENRLQSDPSCLHLDLSKKTAVQEIFDKVKSKALNTRWLKTDIENLTVMFNHGTYKQLKCYATANTLRNSQTDACISGWHGNQVLLHKFIFWDEIRIRDSRRNNEIQSYLHNNKDFYTQNLVKYDIVRDPVGIERRFMLMKPWFSLDGYLGKRVYGPLADEHDLISLRELDFNQIPVATIADAALAREFMHRNVGTELDPFIVTETLADGDTLCKMDIPISLLDKSLLYVPRDLSHDPEGLEYLENEINRAHASGTIALNTLVSLKNMQWLASLA